MGITRKSSNFDCVKEASPHLSQGSPRPYISLYSSEKDWPCHKLVLTDILTIMSEERKRPRAAANLTAENEEIVTLEAQLSFSSNRHIQGRERALRVSYGR